MIVHIKLHEVSQWKTHRNLSAGKTKYFAFSGVRQTENVHVLSATRLSGAPQWDHLSSGKAWRTKHIVCSLYSPDYCLRPATRNIEHELLVVFWSGRNVRNLLDIQEKYLSICSLTCDTNKIFRCQYKILCDLIFDCEHHRFCSSIIMWCLWCIKFPLLCRI